MLIRKEKLFVFENCRLVAKTEEAALVSLIGANAVTVDPLSPKLTLLELEKLTVPSATLLAPA